MERRLAVRQDHINLGDKLVASGNMWYGTALLDDNGNMKGSSLFMDFPSEKELQEWLDIEPYVTIRVWEKIEINKCATNRPWQFNRDESFFEGKLIL